MKERRKTIRQGDTFEYKDRDGALLVCRREQDDPTPVFECERIRVTHLGHSMVHDWTPYTFGTEPLWFTVRGLRLDEDEYGRMGPHLRAENMEKVA